MKSIFAIIAAASVTACTATPAMIDAQKDRCAQVGYQPGTPEHAACTDRGTSQQQAMQNAVAGSIGGIAAGGFIGKVLY